MGRSTFDGPILSGDNRFGALRNVGYTDLIQQEFIDLTVTNPALLNYGGASTQFVQNTTGRGLPGTIWTPSTSLIWPANAPVVPTADTASLIYRGYVLWIPAGADLNDVLIDCAVVPTASGGSVTGVVVNVGNTFNGAQYWNTASFTAIGRQAPSGLTAAQIQAQNAPTTDIVLPSQPGLSQIVFTIAITGTTMGAITAGQFNLALRYNQGDVQLGGTGYPYGNPE